MASDGLIAHLLPYAKESGFTFRYPGRMPRFYFHARGPNRLIPDYQGLEVSDLMTARSISLLAAADVLSEIEGGEHHPDWRFEITGEDGRIVLTIPFSEAMEPGSGRA